MLMHEELTREIIGAAVAVHRFLGPGLLESAYRVCLCHELKLRGFGVRSEIDLPIVYKGVPLLCGYRMDVIVEEAVLLELKAVEKVNPVYEAQLMTYLRLSGYRVGLLINFNVPILVQGVTRRVL